MKKFILLAAVAISLTACTSEDNYIDDPVAAQISATIGDQSRASNIAWDAGDNIGISMSSRYLNMLYTTENGDGTFAGTTMFFRNKVDPETLTAYYPYSGTEGQASPIIEASTTAERQTPNEQPLYDFLYDKKENVTGAEPNVNFTFKHMMCKLTLIFINGNAGAKVSKISSCEINGLVLEGTFNTATGVCAVKPETPSTPLNLTPTVTEDKATLSLIIFPQTVNKLAMKIHDTENQDYACELNFGNNGLMAGNNYQFTIEVKKKELVVSGEIADWITEPLKSEAESTE